MNLQFVSRLLILSIISEIIINSVLFFIFIFILYVRETITYLIFGIFAKPQKGVILFIILWKFTGWK